MDRSLVSFLCDDSAQSLPEYSLMNAFVAVALITILILFRNGIGDVSQMIVDILASER